MRQWRKSFALRAFATVVLGALLGSAAPVKGQEPCRDRSEWTIPGIVRDMVTQTGGAEGWKISKAQVSTIVSQANKLADIILALDYLRNPVGMQVGYYRAIGTPGPAFRGGPGSLEGQPFPLHVEAMIFSFWCINGKVGRRWTDADMGVSIDVNTMFNILDNTTAVIDGKRLYMLKFDLGTFRGHKLFMPYTNQPRDETHYQRSVLIARPDKLPYTHITRRQLLDYMEAEMEKAAPIEAARAASTGQVRPKEEQEAGIKKRIEEIKSYNIGEAAKKARIDRVLADFKTDEQLRDEAVARSKAEFDAMRKRLKELRSKYSEAQLQEPAVVPAQTGVYYNHLTDASWDFADPKIDLNDDCYPRCKFGQYVVTPNEDYFDKSLPRTSFQYFVVTLSAPGDPAKMSPSQLRIRKETLESLDFGALEAMLRK